MPDGGVSEVLVRLLRLSPFTDLYRYSASSSPMREFLCFWIDAALRVAVFIVLVALLLTIAVKVLAPLPNVPLLPWSVSV